ERQQLAEDGIITISATVDGTGKLLGDPTINLRGVVSAKSLTQWESDVVPLVKKSLLTRWKEVLDDPQSDRPKVNWDGLRSRLEEDARRFVRRALPKQYPVTVLMLQHIDGAIAPEDKANDTQKTETPKPKTAGRRRRSLSTASAS
ncbi:MAG: ribonuclease J, partial [Cyanobacteria bacterium J06650_10]